MVKMTIFWRCICKNRQHRKLTEHSLKLVCFFQTSKLSNCNANHSHLVQKHNNKSAPQNDNKVYKWRQHTSVYRLVNCQKPPVRVRKVHPSSRNIFKNDCSLNKGWQPFLQDPPSLIIRRRIICPSNRSRQIHKTCMAYHTGIEYTLGGTQLWFR